MAFPWVIVMLLGGIMLWWSLGKLNVLPSGDE